MQPTKAEEQSPFDCIRISMRPELEDLQIPESLTTPEDRARYCRNRVVELLGEANKEHEPEAKFELLNLAE